MKLSVITINYNNIAGLRKTIDSVVHQTNNDFEYIIIDGGSTDGSVDIIKEYDDKIDYWISESDKGIYNAMNKGVDVAKGEYCIFMNSGDCFYCNETINNVLYQIGDFDIISGNTKESNGRILLNEKEITFKKLYLSTICHQSTFIKTNLLKRFPYDESLKIASDWKFWLQTLIIENCTYKGVDILISIYDVSGISYTNWDLGIEERRIVLNEMFPQRILNVMEELCYGRTWEEKLYLGIRRSKYHKLLYSLNVLFMKMITMFRKSWISEFPTRIK